MTPEDDFEFFVFIEFPQQFSENTQLRLIEN